MKDCPNCPAIWSIDEIQENKCFACGYPDVEDEEDNWGYEDDAEWDVVDIRCYLCGAEFCDCNKRD